MSGPAGPTRGSDHFAPLVPVLERARSFGFLGPGPVEDHIEHARRFDRAIVEWAGGGAERGMNLADIGAGGGVPGLVLLLADQDRRGVLIDAAQKRCSFLVWAAAELGIQERVEIWCGRAEEVGHQARARERFDVVVARGFGPPAQTLECATGLVRPGGGVIISEPPTRRRWPVEGLADLALEQTMSPDGVAVFLRRPGLAQSMPRPPKQQQRRPVLDLD